jgi:hypothetical protein
LKTDEQILKVLGEATVGVFYISESDYPFELIRWDGSEEFTTDFLRNLTRELPEAPIQQIDLEAFLRGRYQILGELLRVNLSSLKVYKVGKINLPVYIVGRSPEGNWLGLSTRVVET